jgi:DNA-binding response OmpR family regulator
MKPSKARIAGQTAKPLILVVDDDPDLLELLRLGFEGAGFSVITAANGPDALQQARSQPDLIVLDLVLPELDGFTVCQTLKRDRATASIPIIMLTGLTSQLSRLAGLECGADDYLRKPVTVAELVASVRTLLGCSASSPSAPQHGARNVQNLPKPR